jgi:hypothetical protein
MNDRNGAIGEAETTEANAGAMFSTARMAVSAAVVVIGIPRVSCRYARPSRMIRLGYKHGLNMGDRLSSTE